jgi:6-phosphogluconolactonase/glucosamine-6-phosphate isomerase/deaminase
LVNGAQKAAQLRRLLEPKISPQFPASFLWLHPAVTLYCDEAANG